MLSRSGFSIRRLMSTRRPRSNSDGADPDERQSHSHSRPEDLDFHDDIRRASRDSETSARSRYGSGPKSPRSPRSPRSQRHGTKTKKAPSPIVVMGRSGSVHRISGPLPPLPDTPHSSASSLCSCDCRGSPCHVASGSRSPGLCPTYTRSKTPTDADGPRPAPPPPHLHLYTANDNCATSNSHPESSNLNAMSFFLNEASPDDNPTTNDSSLLLPALTYQPGPPQSRPRRDGQRTPTSEGISENVRQLIRETDEAFKAVGTVISEAKMVSQSFSGAASSSSQSSSPVLPSQSLFQLQPPSQAETHSPRLPDPRSSPRKDPKPASAFTFPVRKASVAKTKRRKSTKKARRRDMQQQSPKQQQSKTAATSSKSGTRWTLPENVTGLLNGRLFHRIEADEMLTPTQLQEWKQYRMSRMQANRSTETLRTAETDGSETPVEPFHLEDLPTRIGAAGVRLSIPSPIAEVPTPRSFDFGFGPENGAVAKGETMPNAPRLEDGKDKETEQDLEASLQTLPEAGVAGQDGSDDMMFLDLSFPTPPHKSPLRSQPRRQLPPLPTIPEVMVTSPDGASAKPEDGDELKRESQEGAQRQEMAERSRGDDYIFLDSNPYSMTMPAFRHGPIRFSKADVHLLDSTQLVPDETLDWTAFQMAILGGAGDFFSDSVDFTRLADADEVDELAVWFEGFGFEHAGRLVDVDEQPHKDEAMRAKARATTTTTPKNHRRRTASKPTRPVIDTATASPPTAADSPPSPANAGDYSPASSSGNSTPTAAASQPEQDEDQPEQRQMEMVQIQSLPIPVALEYPNSSLGFWQIGQQATGGLTGGLGIRRWTAEGHPKRYLGTATTGSLDIDSADGTRKGSVDTMPPSPMLELVVNRGISGDEYLVPMGYNLGHDLGDFLKWESQNVYAAGFFGSD